MGYYGGSFNGQLQTDLRIYKVMATVILDAISQWGSSNSMISFREYGGEVAHIMRTHPLSGQRLEINDDDRILLSINDMAWLDLDSTANLVRLSRALRIEAGMEIWISGTRLAVDGDGTIRMPNLPTADPHVVGALWNKDGKMEISSG